MTAMDSTTPLKLDLNKSVLLKKRNIKLQVDSVAIETENQCPWQPIEDKYCEAEDETFQPVRQTATKVIQSKGFETLASGNFGRVSSGTIFVDGELRQAARKDFFNKEGSREKSIKEFDILSAISGHSSILKVYSLIIQPNLCFMLMEKGGESLNHFSSLFSAPEHDKNFLIFAKKLTEALSWVHEKKVFHGDLKDENILITFSANDFDIKIVDFGEAGSDFIPFDGTIRGSSFHISPEQFTQDHIPGPHIDVFSAGILLYKMRYNKIPQKKMSHSFTNDYQYYIQNNFESDWNLNSSQAIHDEIDHIIISKMIHPKPDFRPGMKELNHLFNQVFEKRFPEKTSATN